MPEFDQMQFRFAPAAKPRRRTAVNGGSRQKARGDIACLKVTLQQIRPPIWRRLEVPTALSLGAFHSILQVAFGWTDSHLHQFHAGDHRFGMIDDEFEDDIADENTARLDQLLPVYDRLVYEYDFGDSWMHLIIVEKMLEREPLMAYPRCIGGKRAAPPAIAAGRGVTRSFSRPYAIRITRSTSR